MSRNHTNWARCLAVAVLLAGCSTNSTGVNSFDQLTTSAGNSGLNSKAVYLNYPLQTRFLAINGLLPVSGPGSACLADSTRPSTAIVCYSNSDTTMVAYRRYDTNATLADLKKIEADLKRLNVEIVNLLKQDIAASESNSPQTATINAAAQQAAEVANRIAEDSAKRNVFLFRWQAGSEAGASGSLEEIFSGSGSFEAGQSGVVIVGGLTISQLLIGRRDYPTVLGGFSKGTKISTLTMGAEHFVYFADANLSAALAAELDGNLKDFSEKISPSTEFALRAYAAIGQAQENRGAFTAVEQTTIPLRNYASNTPAGHTFFSTMTDVQTLLKALNDK